MSSHKMVGCMLVLALSACASTTSKNFAAETITQANQHIPDSWLLDLTDNISNPSRWGDIYDDPILEKYLRQAQANSFDVRIAQSRVAQAEASLKRASSRLKPSLDLRASASGASVFEDVGNITDAYSLGLNGRWTQIYLAKHG